MLTALLLLGCTTSTSSDIQLCEIDLIEVVPDTLSPGDQAVLTATPLTTDYDTALYLSGVRARVTAVDRSGCEECDTCREDAECLVCQDCDECDALCATDCLETVSFEVPELPPGPATVQLYNAYGGSESLTVEILDAGDTGGTNTGGTDTGAGSTGGTDTGTGGAGTDTGAGSTDGTGTDTGGTDTGGSGSGGSGSGGSGTGGSGSGGSGSGGSGSGGSGSGGTTATP